MKVKAAKSRPFVPYTPPKQLMDAYAKAMQYQQIKGLTERTKQVNK